MAVSRRAARHVGLRGLERGRGRDKLRRVSLLADPRLRFRAIKYALYALLTFNVYLFVAVEGSFYEALDSIGWLILLAVFEWESTHLDEPVWPRWEKALLVLTNLVAYAIILSAWWGYIATGEALDATNATLWLGVAGMLAYDVYSPGTYGDREWKIRNAAKIALYAALFVVALIWGITSDWLDFYDAVLWLLCFFMVELNIFKFETGRDGGAARANA